MTHLLRAISFLTILPLSRGEDAGEMDLGALSPAVGFFPLVGILLGGILLLFDLALSSLVPPPALDALILILLVFLTGGLHLDGLADTVDGLSGGSTREERLRLMKDSRLGALGAAALVLALLAKYGALRGLSPGMRGWGILLFPALSRWSMSLLCWRSTYARAEGGTGRAFTEGVRGKDFLLATVFCLPLSLVGLGLMRAIFILVALAAGALLFESFTRRRLGGSTGDTYGAANEGGEILALLAMGFYQ
ncbi:MAG: adenosylcobinamide-GDP ribazoletransferase [Nitrospinota bacterium]